MSRNNICINCNKFGHKLKNCKEPITSYGIVNIKIDCDEEKKYQILSELSNCCNNNIRLVSNDFPDIICDIKVTKKKITLNKDYEGIHESIYQNVGKYMDKIKFLMVSRKFSIGFIEFIRGKYDVNNISEISNLFVQMTKEEINKIREKNYKLLVNDFTGQNINSKYAHEYNQSEIKFNILVNEKSDEDNYFRNLDYYLDNIDTKWQTQEWGFPKGRKDKYNEDNLFCAIREFKEETGYNESNFTLFDHINPLEEIIVGTNQVIYKHIYYVSLDNNNADLRELEYDNNEIGQIGWFNLTDAVSIIRSYHSDKKNILFKLFSFFLEKLSK